jgi:hypothetical protein
MAGVWISVCSRRSFSRIFGAPQLGRPLELNDQPLDLKRQLVRMPVGPPTAIGQSFEPAILIALEDLVAGLARDIVFPIAENIHRRIRYVSLALVLLAGGAVTNAAVTAR